MRQLLVIVAVVAFVVSADLGGSDRQRRDDARCDRVGAVMERRGLTDRERASLARRHCKQLNGRWVSDRYYQA